jgi:hypothetical protein
MAFFNVLYKLNLFTEVDVLGAISPPRGTYILRINGI